MQVLITLESIYLVFHLDLFVALDLENEFLFGVNCKNKFSSKVDQKNDFLFRMN